MILMRLFDSWMPFYYQYMERIQDGEEGQEGHK